MRSAYHETPASRRSGTSGGCAAVVETMPTNPTGTEPATGATIVVVLAAGMGTRMRSRRPKVLHKIAGRTLLGHVLAAAEPLRAAATLVVVGAGREQVIPTLDGTGARAVVQAEQRGTGHAVRVALDAWTAGGADVARSEGGADAGAAKAADAGAPAAGVDVSDTVVVLSGDVPLLTPQTLTALIAAHRGSGAAATMLTAHAPDPTGYGRVLRDETGRVRRIVEHADATAAERAVTEVNAGIFAFDRVALQAALPRVGTDNAQGEQYLPDALAIMLGDGLRVGTSTADLAETAGINDRAQLAAAGRVLRDRLVTGWMRAGVTVLDPASTWVDVSVGLEADVELLPGVQLLGSTTVAAGARIGPDSTLVDTTVGADAVVIRAHCEGAEIGPAAKVGPFAYLRPGARLARGSKVGTYVEVKAAEIGEGSKVPHLTYVGDATIGAGVNIGASSVFVNYDGVSKRHSVVEDHARTGADNTFVAPVHVGAGAYTGAGAVIRGDVPAGALAVSAGRQRTIEEWTARKRAGTPSADAAARAGGSRRSEGQRAGDGLMPEGQRARDGQGPEK